MKQSGLPLLHCWVGRRMRRHRVVQYTAWHVARLTRRHAACVRGSMWRYRTAMQSYSSVSSPGASYTVSRRVLISERQLGRSERIVRVLRSLRDPSLDDFTQMCEMIGQGKRQRSRQKKVQRTAHSWCGHSTGVKGV